MLHLPSRSKYIYSTSYNLILAAIIALPPSVLFLFYPGELRLNLN